MYPTWEPSEHGEKAKIAAKYGKVSSPHFQVFFLQRLYHTHLIKANPF